MRLGLRTQLLGTTIGLLTLLTVGTLGAVYDHFGRQVREQTGRTLRAGSRVLSSILDRTQEQLRGRGEILIELPSLRAGLTEDRDQLEPLLQEIKRIRTANLLWATDADGVVLASTDVYPPLGADLAQHHLIAPALDGKLGLGFDIFLENWWLLLCLPVTEPDSPELIGTVTLGLLVGEAYLTRLAELVDTDVGFLWEGHQFWSGGWPETARSVVASQGAAAVVGAPRELTLSDGRYFWMARQITVGTYPRVTQPIALLGLELDETVIRDTARAIGWIALGIMVVGAILLIGAIRSITQPLKGLVADSQRVGAGELAHRAKVRGAAEVAQLAISFNDMVGKLRTSRDELVRAKAYTDNVINSTINSIIVTDAQGIIRIVNPATSSLLGYADDELLGRPIQSVFAEDTSLFKEKAWEAFMTVGVMRNVESAYRVKHGKTVPVLFSSAVMRGDDDHITGVVCVAQDITERKHLERLKDEFLGTVSHELLTPLTLINEGVSLMLDELLGTINDEQREFLETTDAHTKRLTRLVQTLLDVSTMDSGQMQLKLQDVDVAELAETALQTAQEAIGKRKIVRQFAPVPHACADRRRILDVLAHLLSNAIQFTQEDGTITVSLEPQDGFITVTVKDNGTGIPREDLERLFGKFVQPGRAEEERSGGAGLGLVFCKKIIELHHGTIAVTSELGHGTSLTFTLPVADSRATSA